MDIDARSRIAQALASLKLQASTDGPVQPGGGLNGIGGYYDAQHGRAVPAYGGSIEIPDTGLSIHGQYQSAPQYMPDNWGVALRYKTQF